MKLILRMKARVRNEVDIGFEIGSKVKTRTEFNCKSNLKESKHYYLDQKRFFNYYF